MQEQFSALIHLKLGLVGPLSRYHSDSTPALPDNFLGGSIPRLQSLELQYIPFPALPKLLLSATDLVHLNLQNIPRSGYISPEAAVTGLAVSANLESLTIGFESIFSFRDWESRPLPPTRTVFPALTRFRFNGVSEYLEDLVARVDAPLLDSISITFFRPSMSGIPQLAQFMRRTTRLEGLNEAHVYINCWSLQVKSFSSCERNSGLIIGYGEMDWGLSSLVHVFTSLFPSLYVVEHLYIYEHQGPRRPRWQYEVGNLMDFFRPFAAVKNLYVCREFAQRIARELVGERETEVLPVLQNIYWRGLLPSESGPIEKGIGEFVAARLLLGHPIAASYWH
jgi:hypothetical protein